MKPCPFCGKRAAIDALKSAGGTPPKFRAQCGGCLAATRWLDAAAQAREAWDCRAEAPEAGAGGRRNPRGRLAEALKAYSARLQKTN